MKNILVTIVTATFLISASVIMAGVTGGNTTFSAASALKSADEGTMDIVFVNGQSLSKVGYTKFLVSRACTNGDELDYIFKFKKINAPGVSMQTIDNVPSNYSKISVQTQMIVMLQNGTGYICNINTPPINLSSNYAKVMLNFNFGNENQNTDPRVQVTLDGLNNDWFIANCDRV